MKNYQCLLLFVLFVLLLPSCNDDDYFDAVNTADCPEFVELGPYYMLESVLDYFPYDENMSRLIFTDADGKEFRGFIRDNEFNVNTTTYTMGHPCEEDSTQFYRYKINRSSWSFRVDFNQLDVFLFISIAVNAFPQMHLNFGEQENQDSIYFTDQLSVALLHPEPSGTPSGLLTSIINARNHPSVTPKEIDAATFEFHGKKFENVYFSNYSNDVTRAFQLYYNTEFGLIGFENEDKSISLSFDRIEYD